MNPRLLPTADYMRLKAAFRELVTKVGGPTAAEKVTRVDKERISRYGNPNESTFAPMDVVLDLEAEVNDPIVTRCMAEMAGYSMAQKDAVPAETTIAKEMAEAGRDMNEAANTFLETTLDGKIDALDAIKIEAKAGEAIRELEEVRATAKRIISRQVVVPLGKTA